ncbi:MAG: DapH/DapD/GlmU-related protein [Myxococcota bacterium]
MTRVYVQLEQDLAAEPLAGRTVADHWRWLVGRAGLHWTDHPEGAVVVPGGWLALSPEALRRLVDAHASTPGSVGASGPYAGEHVAYDASSVWKAEPHVVRQYVAALAQSGVRVHDPDRVWVETTVEVAPGASLWAGCVLRGATRVAAGAIVHPGAILDDTLVGERAEIKPYTVCEGATIGPDCAVGPMAHLRPGTVLVEDVKVGNFVEVKKSTLHPGVRASHLTYLGDAEVHDGANIGAGTITCNYDGFGKYRTEIGAGAFVGSNSSLVAPVRIGAGAIVGAGSTVSRDVPDEALMVERADERVLTGKAPRIRERNRARAGRGRE